MKTMKRITNAILYVVAVICLLNVGACKKVSSFDYPPAVGTAFDVLKNDNNYSTFVAAIIRSGTTDLFQGGTAYTIYAPTNTAIINQGYTVAQINNTLSAADLAVFVKSHIVAGAVDVTGITGTVQQTTLAGTKIALQKVGSLLYVNGGDITNPSLTVTNGFLNIITTVLTSKTDLLAAVNTYNVTTNAAGLRLDFLVTALNRASTGSVNFNALLTGSTPYTFFAPDNTAFTNAGYSTVALINAAPVETLVSLLKYQLVAGSKLTTDFDYVNPVTAYSGTPLYFDKSLRTVTATTTIANNFTYFFANGTWFGNSSASNMIAGNGVMHIVNGFFPAPIASTTMARITSDATLTEFAALVQRASSADPNYNFAAWLADPLKSYTVYAINNTGLQAAGYASVAAINAEDPAVLAKILKFHIIPIRFNYLNLADNGTVATLLNDASNNPTYITFTVTGGPKVKGNTNAAAIAVSPFNIVTTNGLLNVIGTVLTP